MADEERRCDLCRYYARRISSGGECRRHAPRPITMDAGTGSRPIAADWPIVTVDDWCGEFMNASDFKDLRSTVKAALEEQQRIMAGMQRQFIGKRETH